MSGSQSTAHKRRTDGRPSRRVATRPRTGRDPFWRNRRSFLLTTLLAALVGSVLTASVAAAPAGETSAWSFETGSGTTALSSTTASLDGSLVNSPAWSGLGAIGGSLDFAGGAEEQVQVPDPAGELGIGADGQITISAWFKSTNPFASGANPVLLQRLGATGYGYSLSFDIGADSRPIAVFDYIDPTLATSRTYSVTVDSQLDGDWHHIAVAVNGTQTTIWVDGMQRAVGSRSGVPLDDSPATFIIGAGALGATNDFDGEIDEVAIYSGALTQTGITDLYDDRTAPSTPTVNSTGSASDIAPGDGVCFTGLLNSEGVNQCSLHAAIEETNAGPSNTIHFAIPTSDLGYSAGVWTIDPTAELPQITSTVTVDARTQPGWVSTPVIAIDGDFDPGANGIRVGPAAPNSEIYGLSIINYRGTGLVINGDGTTVTENFIGIGADGLTPAGNLVGVGIGGNATLAVVRDNVISGNTDGLTIDGLTTTDNVIDGNMIGTDPSGLIAIPNNRYGIFIVDSPRNIVGRNEGNVISGNSSDGVALLQADDTIIENNFIGVGADATTALANGGAGIRVQVGSDRTVIGSDIAPNTIAANDAEGIRLTADGFTTVTGNFIGTNNAGASTIGNASTGIGIDAGTQDSLIEQNTISFNGSMGVSTAPGSTATVSLRENTFFQNTGLAIDLDNNGVTVNDVGDADTGSNGLLNYPEILRIEDNGANTTVFFTLDSDPGPYVVDFFSNPGGGDPSGFGEGQQLLVPWTNPSHTLPSPVYTHIIAADAGDLVTSLATQGTSASPGATSEFSPLAVVGTPDSVIVNSTGDLPDTNPGDGTCSTGALNATGLPECTLRAAISETNASAKTTIQFGIPATDAGHAAGLWTITPATTLPWVTNNTQADARTQAGWTASSGPVIILDGVSASEAGLIVNAADALIAGFSVVNFPQYGIQIDSSSDITVAGNYAGVFPDGQTAGANGLDGIYVASAGRVSIGGTEGGNVTSGNRRHGVSIQNSSEITVNNNLIGVTATGNAPLGNGGDGVLISSGNSDTIIGELDAGNVIGGNTGSGVYVGPSSNTMVSYNSIGIDATETTALGNTGAGIAVLGATSTELDENAIAFNGGDGIDISASTTGETGLFSNRIWENGGLGLDLGSDGPTLNDAGDGDTGPNDLLNYPVISDIRTSAWGFVIDYDLDAPAGSYVAKFFTNPSGLDPSGFGEGEVLLEASTINHPGGSASYTSPRLLLNNGQTVTTQLIRPSPTSIASEFGPQFMLGSVSSAPVVNSTDDDADANPGDGLCSTGQLNVEGDPECTLRAAIEEANANVDETAITFAIPIADPGHSSGVWTIAPTSALSPLTTNTDIDGTTQPGAGILPAIDLVGSALVGPPRSGIEIAATATDSSIRGLAIGGFGRDGIEIAADQVVIAGNIIGLRANGVTTNPNSDTGIFVDSADGVILGGANPADRNVISANGFEGIYAFSGTTNLAIDGNYIGTDVTGQIVRGNGDGILIDDSNSTTIGTLAGNIISGNTDDGIVFAGTSGNAVVVSNIIGLAADGLSPLGNGLDGIHVRDSVSGLEIGDPGRGNTIAANGQSGVILESTSVVLVTENIIGTNAAGAAGLGNGHDGVRINTTSSNLVASNVIANNTRDGIAVTAATPRVAAYGNVIYGNGGIAMDLGDDGVTVNDSGDGDTGPNDLLNYPIIESVDASSNVSYTIDAPADEYRVYLYNNPSGADPSGFGEAEELVYSSLVSHPGGSIGYVTTAVAGIDASDALSMQLVVVSSPEAGKSSEYGPYNALPPAPAIAVVNSTSDAEDSNLSDGICWTGALNSEGLPECTLHAAIKQMNNIAGENSIHFAIPTSDPGHAAGVWTINPTTDPTASFPDVTGETNIDATTQPGYAGTPVVRLDGTGLDATLDGIMFNIGSDNSTLRGFSIVNMPDNGVWTRVDGVSIVGNYVGLNPDGTASANDSGVVVWDTATNTTIGGSGTDQNVISGNSNSGVRITAPGTTDTSVINNLIGVAPDASTPRPNLFGIRVLDQATNTTISGNTIAENAAYGLELDNTTNASVFTNTFFGNQDDHIRIENSASTMQIGDIGLGNTLFNGGADGISLANSGAAISIIGNEIYNNDNGVTVSGSASQAAIVSNSIYAQAALGIDLDRNGPTPNDALDVDTGPNGLLNTPVLVRAVDQALGTDLELTIEPPTGTSDYLIEIYDNPLPGPAQARTLIHQETVNYFGSGQRTYNLTVPSGGTLLTATLTSLSGGSPTATSEVSSEIAVAVPNTITNPGAQTDRETDAITLQIDAVAGGAAPITYAATGLPDGLAINTSTGLISGTLSYDSAGTYSVTVTATSDDAGSAAMTFSWSIANQNRVPALAILGRTNTEGDTITWTVTATDADGDPLTFSALNLPPGLSIDAAGNITGVVGYDSASAYTTQVNVFDGTNSAGAAFNWQILDVNRPPTLTTPGLWADNEDQAVSRNIFGVDPDGDVITWSATGLPPGLTIDAVTGDITGRPTFTAAGNYPTVITADDQRTAGSQSILVNWLIYDTNRAPTIEPIGDQNLVIGSTVDIALSATDPDGSPIVWSATGLPAGLTLDASGPRITGTVTAIGTSTVNIVAEDPLGATASTPSTWTISAPTTTTTSPPTTVAPTTTLPTTTAAPTVAPTTTAAPATTSTSTTSTSTTTAPTTSTAAAPTTVAPTTVAPTTVPTPDTAAPPDALPFAELRAVSDRVRVANNTTLIDVLTNDSFGENAQILSVTQPAVGSVALVDGQIEVTVPASFAGEVLFTYTLTDDSGVSSTTDVAVFSVNVLTPAGDLVQPKEEISSLSDVFGRATELFTGIISIRLTTIQLGILAFGPMVFGLLRVLLVRRENLLAVTNTARTAFVETAVDDTTFSLRHDALIWSTGKCRTNNGVKQIRVELPNGQSSWIEEKLVTDTGY